MSKLFTNLIGFVYITKDAKEVKLSYVGPLGERVNLDLPANDIKPLDPLKSNYLYYKVSRLSSSSDLKITLTFGEILNTEGFKIVFGFDPDQPRK